VRTGRTQLAAPLTAEHLASISRSAEEAVAYGQLQPTSVLVAPLIARTTLGAIMFCRTTTREVFTPVEMELAEDLARRAATALDNAALFEEAQRARGRTERLQAVTAKLAAVLPEHELAELFVAEVRAALCADA